MRLPGNIMAAGMLAIAAILWAGQAAAQGQTADQQYRRTLQETLEAIQTRFDVTLKYKDDMVRDKWITYADWRFVNGDVEQTLRNILTVYDLSFVKQGDRLYKIKPYEYYRKSVAAGQQQLAYLATLYHDKASWEVRKAELKPCLREALQLMAVPPAPNTKPVLSAVRKMDGYTVQNVALETLPGVYVCGSIYRPAKSKGKHPIILCPNGHFGDGRYRPDQQIRCATLARMGAITISYDLFAWGESLLQFKEEDHRRSAAMVVQVINSLRILDYLCTLPEADTGRVGITGGSGGGSHTMLITALDDRIKVSVPVVMLSCYFSGGCPCESGMPIHLCGQGTNNVELAAMAAPRPQLIISDGKDWTDHVPEIEFPYLQKIYRWYGQPAQVQNAHFATEGHDYGPSKRLAMYPFMAAHLDLDIRKVTNKTGDIDESCCTVEKAEDLYAFGPQGEKLPAHAIHTIAALEAMIRPAGITPEK